jgi:hypothetical protein
MSRALVLGVGAGDPRRQVAGLRAAGAAVAAAWG